MNRRISISMVRCWGSKYINSYHWKLGFTGFRNMSFVFGYRFGRFDLMFRSANWSGGI